MAEEKWIRGAIKHKGALRAYAKKQGKLNKEGNIDKDWLAGLAKGDGVWAKRARLAQTLSKLRG